MNSYPVILSSLPRHVQQSLDQVMIETELSEGSVLFKQRDEVSGMIILKYGRLQVVTGKFAVPAYLQMCMC